MGWRATAVWFLFVYAGFYLLLPVEQMARNAAEFNVTGLLGGESAGFARATAPARFNFPADHGPHDAFRNEWWYITGNLHDDDGRAFGYQLTFFRFALTTDEQRRDSAWATRQVYMAHFSLTDVERERFYSFERFSRAALGLSGARSQPFKVWLDDWVIRSQGDDLFPLQLHAATDEVAVEFQLATNKPLVLQGDGGLSRKSAEPGNASYYYSYTTMPTRGTLRIGNETFSVSGTSWMDREWSTSALADNQQGWDWFALQLSDQRELMFYQLRKKNGQPDTFSAGTLVAADGSVERIALQDIRLEPLKNWTSPVTGKTYPVKWRLALPERNLDLLVEAQVPSQEVNHRVTYWEGAVRVTGRDHGKPVTGQGYLELAGY